MDKLVSKDTEGVIFHLHLVRFAVELFHEESTFVKAAWNTKYRQVRKLTFVFFVFLSVVWRQPQGLDRNISILVKMLVLGNYAN